MRKWIVMMVALLVAFGVQAGKKDKGPVTKEKYIAAEQQKAEKKGKEFDEAKVAKKFDKMDKNGDGVLTADEMPPKKGEGKKDKSEDDDDEE